MKGMDRALLLVVLIGGACLVLGLALFLRGDDRSNIPLDSDQQVPSVKSSPVPMEWDDEEAYQERILLEGNDAGKASPDLAHSAISGRIMSEFGGPVPEAIVCITPKTAVKIGGDFGDKVQARGPDVDISGRSDREGRFRLTGVPEAEVIRIHISHPDYVPALVSVKSFAGESRDVGDIVLDAGGAISGVVTDENGLGIDGVEVSGRVVEMKGGTAFFSFSTLMQTGSDWKTTTAPDGFYRIGCLPSGKARVRAYHPERLSVEVTDIAVEKGRETGNVNLVMLLGLTIAGWVRDREGSPIEGAKVAMEPDLDFGIEDLADLDLNRFKSYAPEITDERGFFLMKGLKPGQHTLIIAASSYLTAREDRVAAGTRDLVVVLSKGGWLAGRVLDAKTHEGIEEFSIDLDDENLLVLKGVDAAERGSEEPRGAYFIEGLGMEAFDLRVRAEGYAEEKVEGLTSGPGRSAKLDILLWEESTISGRLVGPSGEVVPEGRIILQSQSPAENDVQEALDRIGMSLPVGNPWNEVKSTTSDENGLFLLRGISEGAYRLKASHELHIDAEPLELAICRSEKVEGLEIRLGLGGSIEGLALDVKGAPLPGVRVMISRSSGLFSIVASAVAGNEPDIRMMNERTDSGGKFQVKGLEAGTYRLQLAPEIEEESLGGILNSTLSGVMGKAGPGAIEAHVKEGEVTEVVLRDTPKCGIAGTMLEAGIPVPGIKVKLFQSGLGPLAVIPLMTTSTDEDGTYLFKKLEQGKYDVKVDLPGQAEPLEESVTLAAGRIALQDFVLPSGRVCGTVTDAATGDPLLGIEVSLNKAGKVNDKSKGFLDSLFSGSLVTIEVDDNDLGDEARDFARPPAVTTDDQGRYMIRFVADGDYKISASGMNYSESTLSPVKVTGGSETARRNLKLTRGYEVTGKVMEEALGKPVGFCKVTLEMNGKEKTTRTNEKGLFSFKGLEPGTYRLGARKKNRESLRDLLIVKEDVKDLVVNIR